MNLKTNPNRSGHSNLLRTHKQCNKGEYVCELCYLKKRRQWTNWCMSYEPNTLCKWLKCNTIASSMLGGLLVLTRANMPITPARPPVWHSAMLPQFSQPLWMAFPCSSLCERRRNTPLVLVSLLLFLQTGSACKNTQLAPPVTFSPRAIHHHSPRPLPECLLNEVTSMSLSARWPP